LTPEDFANGGGDMIIDALTQSCVPQVWASDDVIVTLAVKTFLQLRKVLSSFAIRLIHILTTARHQVRVLSSH
jgi:hypothetical protein